jgi:hypothetical protein
MTPSRARWVIGRCWLYCQRPDAVVTWIGPVNHNGREAPMYACQPCLDILGSLVRAHAETTDRTPVTVL